MRIIPIISVVSLLAFPLAYTQANGLNTFYNLTGSQDGEQFGYPVGFIGDVNNDTYEDFAISALGYDTGGFTDVGRVAIYSGQTGSVIREHTQPVGGVTDPNSAFFGSAFAGIGDVNGDGSADYAIMDPRFSTGLFMAGGTDLNEFGRIIAYSGANGSELWTYTGTSPFQFRFGNALMMLTNDYNSDGKKDIAVGAPRMEVNARQAGAIFILDSVTGSLLTQYDGSRAREFVGQWFDTGFDINGDSKEDFIVGDPFFTQTQFAQGRARILSGADFSTIYTQDTPTPERFGFFGFSVRFVGDTNNDSVADFAVTSQETTGGFKEAGIVKVFSGAANTLLSTYNGGGNSERFGNRLAFLGDVNNDGYADFVASSLLSSGSGRAEVFNSKPKLLWDRISAGAAGEEVGSDVDGGKDINKDGVPDIILGSTGGQVGATEPGRARVVISDRTHLPTGSNVEIFPVLGNQSFKLTFSSITGAGNISYSYLGQISTGANFRTRQGSKEEGWSITASATYSGAISTCLKWNSAVGYTESQLQLQHFESGSWVNITATKDTVNDIACGSSSVAL